MAKNIEMNYYNGTEYEQIYPKTSGEVYRNLIFSPNRGIYWNTEDSTSPHISVSKSYFTEELTSLDILAIPELDINFSLFYSNTIYGGEDLIIRPPFNYVPGDKRKPVIYNLGVPEDLNCALNASYGLFGGTSPSLDSDYYNLLVYCGTYYSSSNTVARTFNLPRLYWESSESGGIMFTSLVFVESNTSDHNYIEYIIKYYGTSFSNSFTTIKGNFGQTKTVSSVEITSHVGDEATGEGYWLAVRGQGYYDIYVRCK